MWGLELPASAADRMQLIAIVFENLLRLEDMPLRNQKIEIELRAQFWRGNSGWPQRDSLEHGVGDGGLLELFLDHHAIREQCGAPHRIVDEILIEARQHQLRQPVEMLCQVEALKKIQCESAGIEPVQQPSPLRLREMAEPRTLCRHRIAK